ncbi:MAG TPA: TolC family protein, partial [Candidatus Cloacimonadota bacterium]|nr:TolC family protein [Candidatus Cloacimonadota bacterium]
IAKGSFLPTLMLTGSRQYKENGLDRYDFEASNQIMLNLSIPLLPQVGNYAAARKAYFDAEKQRYEAESAIAGIKLGIEAAAINLISSARQVESAQLSLQITQDMYDQLLERFRLNMLSGMELLDAELMLSASRLANNNAFYNFFKARLALLTAMGTDDYSVLNTLLQR